MPIIALLFSTLAFWVVYWFIRMGGIDHVHSILTRRKDEARRAAARERERSASLRAIDSSRCCHDLDGADGSHGRRSHPRADRGHFAPRSVLMPN